MVDSQESQWGAVTGPAPSGFTQEAQGMSLGAGSPGHNLFCYLFFNKRLSFLVKNWAAQFLWILTCRICLTSCSSEDYKPSVYNYLFIASPPSPSSWSSTSVYGIKHRMLIVLVGDWGLWKTMKRWYRQRRSKMNLIYIVPLVTKWCSKNTTPLLRWNHFTRGL